VVSVLCGSAVLFVEANGWTPLSENFRSGADQYGGFEVAGCGGCWASVGLLCKPNECRWSSLRARVLSAVFVPAAVGVDDRCLP